MHRTISERIMRQISGEGSVCGFLFFFWPTFDCTFCTWWRPIIEGCLQPLFWNWPFSLLFAFICEVLKIPNLARMHLTVKLQSNATIIVKTMIYCNQKQWFSMVAFDCNFTGRCVRAKFEFFSTLQTNTNRKWKRPLFNFRKGVAGALYYRVPWGAKPEQNVDAYLWT